MSDDIPAFKTRASLREDLENLGVKARAAVMVHAVMSKVGPMPNGAERTCRT